MKNLLWIGLVLITILFFAFVWGKSEKENAISQQDSKELFASYCVGCHNAQKSSFVNRSWLFGNEKDEIYNSIKNGRQSFGMPSFAQGLNENQINGLADYILSLQGDAMPEAEQTKVEPGSIYHSEVQDYKIETVVDDLLIPWGMAFLPNGDMLINEIDGRMILFTKANKKIEIDGVPEVFHRGQGGLLDLKLDPNYEKNGWIYFSYSSPNEKNKDIANTAIMRARLKGHKLVDQERLFKAGPETDTRHHFGSKLEFDKDGYLYFSVGDRGNRDLHPQYLDNDCGKIHRINSDGSVPSDNPFVNDPNARPTIYSYGHRNPQGLCLNPGTGQIWEDEHGPKGGDEINLIEKGKNYGWPVISFGINYNGTTFTNDTAKVGMEQPILYWVPSIAPCGMTFVKGDKYPNWKNNILTGSLKFHYVQRVVLDGNKVVGQEKLFEGIGRVRNVEMGSDGYIYVAVEGPGRIFKVIPL